jgi:hypothetical protein
MPLLPGSFFMLRGWGRGVSRVVVPRLFSGKKDDGFRSRRFFSTAGKFSFIQYVHHRGSQKNSLRSYLDIFHAMVFHIMNYVTTR